VKRSELIIESHDYIIAVCTKSKAERLQALSSFHDVLQSAFIAGLITHTMYTNMVIQAGRLSL
jgi:hypothetical protein